VVMGGLYGKTRAVTRQFCVSTFPHLRKLVPSTVVGEGRLRWQTVCSTPLDEWEQRESKARTAARWSSPWRAITWLSGVNGTGSTWYTRDVHRVVYATSHAAMDDAAASHRVLRPEFTGERATAHCAATQGGRL